MKPPGWAARWIPIGAGILLAGLPHHAIAQGAIQPDPEKIFERARLTWSGMTYPSLLDYHIAVTIDAGPLKRTDHYAGEAEPATGECRVHAFSVEEAANPYVPHGIDVRVRLSVAYGTGRNGIGAKKPTPMTILDTNVNPTPSPITFGVPDLSPLYSFGMRAGERHVADVADPTAPKTIGRVLVLNRRYDVRLIERAPVDGTDAYHLGLTPLSNPQENRLRDLWVDASTFDVLQARIAGNFTDKPAATVPWLIRFRLIDGATYIASETAEAPLPDTPLTFDDVTISFEAVEQRHGSRDLLFAVPHALDARGHVFEPNEFGGRGLPAHSC